MPDRILLNPSLGFSDAVRSQFPSVCPGFRLPLQAPLLFLPRTLESPRVLPRLPSSHCPQQCTYAGDIFNSFSGPFWNPLKTSN